MVPRTNLRAGDKGTRVRSGRGQREELHGDGGDDPRTHNYEVSRRGHAANVTRSLLVSCGTEPPKTAYLRPLQRDISKPKRIIRPASTAVDTPSTGNTLSKVIGGGGSGIMVRSSGV
jgi:hypothetical protein